MKLLLSLLLITYTFTMQAQTPLIDRAIFFGNPEISGGQLSPDGKYVSFLQEYEGIMNIWVKKFNESFEDARLLTESKSPILGYFWSYDSENILYVNDKDGDENMNIFAVDPKLESDETPPSRNLTPLEEVRAQIYDVSKKDPNILMIGLNNRDKAWHDLYRLNIATGELTLVFENNNRITGWDFDWDENLRLAYRTDEQGNSQILRVKDENQFELIYETNIKENAYVAGWNPDNTKCYLVSNKGDVDLSSLYQMDPSTGTVTFLESDPADKVDFGGLFLHEQTREILYTSYILDKRKRYWKNQEWEAMYAFLEEKFPGREVGFTSFTKDLSKMLISVSGDSYATEVYFFDSETKELILQYIPRPALKEVEEHLSSMTPISYKSSDSLDIPAYLSLPKGDEKNNLPTVIVVHGGPKGPRDYWGYDGLVQFLNNRGYAVLQPNFRASGGFGKAFLNAGDKQWGKLMQDDITYGAKYLIDQNIADPDRIAIMGGSYGGYATLAGLAFTPDLYTCGIDIVGPSNLFTLLESIPPYWEAGRVWLYEMVGDPNTEEGKKLLTEASPLFSADKIDAPLLIVQGANDPRVKQAEADQIVIALREKGHDVQYLLAEDEGHGFRKPLNRMAMYARSEEFLAHHLGGRYQKDIPADVQATLDEITVDITEVTYTEPVDIEAIQSWPIGSMPEISTGDYHYDVTLTLGEQKINMELIRTISLENEQLSITDVMTGPMGEAVDSALHLPSLQPLSRHIKQAGQDMEIKYEDHHAVITAMGAETDIDAPGIIVSDGPSYDLFVAALNLQDGEEKSFYVLDVMSGKPKQILATHKGVDNTTPGHYMVELTDIQNQNDTTTIWINPDLAMAARIRRIIPGMGGAVMDIVLKE